MTEVRNGRAIHGELRGVCREWSRDCASCGEGESERCPSGQSECGHHCNHSWSHDRCCWCGQEFGEAEPWDADECRCPSGGHTCGKPNP